MKGFSGDSKTRSPSTAYSPFTRESRTSRNEIFHSPLVHPEISFVDNLVFTFGSLRNSGEGDEIRNNGKTTGGADWLSTFVFNTLNRVTVVVAP